MIYHFDSLPENADYYFIIYQCCIPVKGYTRSILCDTQRGDIHLVPSMMLNIIELAKNMSVSAIKQSFNHEHDEIIEEYFQFLIDRELGFLGSEDEIDLFPPIDLTWKTPSTITNAIVDSNRDSNHDFVSIAQQLSDLKCQAVELRFYDTLTLDTLGSILKAFDGTEIASIYLILPFNEEIHKDSLLDLLLGQGRVESFTIHSSKRDEQYYLNNKLIVFSVAKITDQTHCGLILSNYFTPNLNLFTESQHHNTCLNRKIAVDVQGAIKNCPSMSISYGNIRNTTLNDALDTPGFTSLWGISKDQIDICKDCEFRHVCTDCRAYLRQPDNPYSKPLKCGYDPYLGVWEDWSINPLKQALQT